MWDLLSQLYEEKEISTLVRVEICRIYSHTYRVEDKSNHI